MVYLLFLIIVLHVVPPYEDVWSVKLSWVTSHDQTLGIAVRFLWRSICKGPGFLYEIVFT